MTLLQQFSVFDYSEWVSAFCEKLSFMLFVLFQFMLRSTFLFLLFHKCLKPHKLIVLKTKSEIRAECIRLRELLAVAELRDVATVGCVWWEINDVVDEWRGAWK